MCGKGREKRPTAWNLGELNLKKRVKVYFVPVKLNLCLMSNVRFLEIYFISGGTRERERGRGDGVCT